MASRTSVRIGLIVVLNLCLLLTIARQICDFLGRLWLSILVNFLHILFVTFGLFGAVQYRLTFVTVYVVWIPFKIAWNIFLILFYLNIAIFNRNDPILSFGFESRLSHSFFTRNNPFCKTGYNFTTGKWISDDKCLIHYYHLETIQAAIHIILLFVTLYYSIAFLLHCRRKERNSSDSSDSLSRRRQPTVTVEFSNPVHPSSNNYDNRPNGFVPNANIGYQSDSNEISSGYMNTSFESTPSGRNGFVPSLDPNGVLVQGYQRKSKKRKKKNRPIRQDAPVPARSADDMSLTSARGENIYNEQMTVQIHDRKNSHSRQRESGRRKNRTRSVSPPRRKHSGNMNFESRMGPDVLQQNEASLPEVRLRQEEPIYQRNRPRSSSLKQKPYKHYLVGGLAPKVVSHSQDQLVSARSKGSTPSLQDYSMEPKRLSVAEVRGLRSSTDSILNPSPQKAKIKNVPATSLVTFDPKSNTLLRYSQLAKSEETLPSDSSFSNLPPPPPDLLEPQVGASRKRLTENYQQNQAHADRISYDSGIPPSGPSSESAFSDPAVKQSYEPVDCKRNQIYEPIYAPRFLKPQNPTSYHSHYANFLNAYNIGGTDNDQNRIERRSSIPEYESDNVPTSVPLVNDRSLLV